MTYSYHANGKRDEWLVKFAVSSVYDHGFIKFYYLLQECCFEYIVVYVFFEYIILLVLARDSVRVINMSINSSSNVSSVYKLSVYRI